MKKKIPIAVVVVAVVAIIFIFFGGRGYKSVAKTYAKAYLNADAKKLVSLLPDGRVQTLIDDWYSDVDEIVRDVQSSIDSNIRELKASWDPETNISYKIVSAEDYTGNELKELKQDYIDNYHEKVSKAKEIVIEFSAKNKERNYSDNKTITVVKIGRSWYVAYASSIM